MQTKTTVRNHLILGRMVSSKDPQTTNAGEWREGNPPVLYWWESSCTIGGNPPVLLAHGEQNGGPLRKLKIDPYHMTLQSHSWAYIYPSVTLSNLSSLWYFSKLITDSSSPSLSMSVYILSRPLITSYSYLQINTYEVYYQVCFQLVSPYTFHSVCVSLTTGIEKPGCLLLPQRNQIKSFNSAPPSHSPPANYFPVHLLFHMLTGHCYSSSPTLRFTACLFHLSIHPSWKCRLATQNRFQRVRAVILLLPDFSLIQRR